MDENRNCSEEQNSSHKPKSKNGFYVKIIALALCCAIFGGVIGGGVVVATGNFIAEKELSDILDIKDFTFRRRFNIWPSFIFSFGATMDEIKDEILTETYIGVSVKDSTDPEGALLSAVEKGGPAAKGGLKDGDVVTMINNQKIDSGDDLAKMIGRAEAGDELTFTVYRQDETFDCNVTVGERSRFEN